MGPQYRTNFWLWKWWTYRNIRRGIARTVGTEGSDCAWYEDAELILLRQLDDVVDTLDVDPAMEDSYYLRLKWHKSHYAIVTWE